MLLDHPFGLAICPYQDPVSGYIRLGYHAIRDPWFWYLSRVVVSRIVHNPKSRGDGGWGLAQHPQAFATHLLAPTQTGGWTRVEHPIPGIHGLFYMVGETGWAWGVGGWTQPGLGVVHNAGG